MELCAAAKNVIALAAGGPTDSASGTTRRRRSSPRGCGDAAARGGGRRTPGHLRGAGGDGRPDRHVLVAGGRNRRAGELIAQGATAEEARAEIGMVVEGLTTAPVLRDLSRTLDIELPITEGGAVLEGVALTDLVEQLMRREPTWNSPGTLSRHVGSPLVLVHLRVGHRRPSGQDRRPDLRLRSRRGSRGRHERQGRLRDADHDRLVVVAGEITTETWVDVRAVVRERIAEIGYTRRAASTTRPAESWSRSTSSRATSRRAWTSRTRRSTVIPTARLARGRRPGNDVRVRDARDRGADAAPDLPRAQARSGSPRCGKPTCSRTSVPTARHR